MDERRKKMLGPGFALPEMLIVPEDHLFPLKPGGEPFSHAPEAPSKTLRFVFRIALGEKDVAEGEPLVEHGE
jgi:hypothetical protein